VHDSQLSDDPELLEAAGAVTLLALENAELDSAWKQALAELADSHARLATAGDKERRKLERDLHDGAQQRLMAVQIKLRMALEHADAEHAEELWGIQQNAAEAVDELRALAHGIYPPVLRDGGIADALRSVAMSAPIPIKVSDEGIGRREGVVEAAVYYCCLEAVQNASKHAGPGARVTIALGRDPQGVHFEIADDGVGLGTRAATEGMGLLSMRDRIGAVGGELEISSSPGTGTIVRGAVPDISEVSSEVPAGRATHRRFFKRWEPSLPPPESFDDTGTPSVATRGTP
jgi:signal transduction histidine kinase